MSTQTTKQSFTKECTYMAITRLMESKKLGDITITELANVAGVSRTAFYKNFSSVEDVIVQYFKDNPPLDSEAVENFLTFGDDSFLRKLLESIFDYIDNNKVILKRLIPDSNLEYLHDWLKKSFLEDYSSLANRLGYVSQYEIVACAGIFFEIAKHYIHSEMDKSSREQAVGALYHLVLVYDQAHNRRKMHFETPAYEGKLDWFNAIGTFRRIDNNEGMTVFMLVENDIIVRTSFILEDVINNEQIVRAAGNAGCFIVQGKQTVAAMSITAQDVAHELNGLTGEYMYCAALASGAIKNASIDYYNRISMGMCLAGEEEKIIIGSNSDKK